MGVGGWAGGDRIQGIRVYGLWFMVRDVGLRGYGLGFVYGLVFGGGGGNESTGKEGEEMAFKIIYIFKNIKIKIKDTKVLGKRSRRWRHEKKS
jgi:hypothetical protein